MRSSLNFLFIDFLVILSLRHLESEKIISTEPEKWASIFHAIFQSQNRSLLPTNFDRFWRIQKFRLKIKRHMQHIRLCRKLYRWIDYIFFIFILNRIGNSSAFLDSTDVSSLFVSLLTNFSDFICARLEIKYFQPEHKWNWALGKGHLPQKLLPISLKIFLHISPTVLSQTIVTVLLICTSVNRNLPTGYETTLHQAN